jgi:tripeptide aminopeptidase
MDTVPLCKGAIPVIKRDKVVSKNNTGLGGDDRAGCAAMVTLAETILKNKIPHPPITFLFVIAEEGGLFGSKMVKLPDLGNPVMGFNLDGQYPNEVVIGAMSATRWKVNITGRSAHAGLEPEKGISAALIAAKAISTIEQKGFFGKIVQGNELGTSNVGKIYGGEASNQVMDQLIVEGECRSHNPTFLEKIIQVHRHCFKNAAETVKNTAQKSGQIQFETTDDYHAFRLAESEPCVQIVFQAMEKEGIKPNPTIMDAGLYANNLNEKGLPTVTLGTGTHHFHTTDEYVNIQEYLTTCRLLVRIIQQIDKK